MDYDWEEIVGEYAPEKLLSDTDFAVSVLPSVNTASGALGPAEKQIIATASKAVIDGLIEYGKVKQAEETKRTAIRAELKRQLHIIDAQKEVYIHALKANTAQKMYLYQSWANVLNRAAAIHDMEMMQMCHQAMMDIYSLGGTNIQMPNVPLVSD